MISSVALAGTFSSMVRVSVLPISTEKTSLEEMTSFVRTFVRFTIAEAEIGSPLQSAVAVTVTVTGSSTSASWVTRPLSLTLIRSVPSTETDQVMLSGVKPRGSAVNWQVSSFPLNAFSAGVTVNTPSTVISISLDVAFPPVAQTLACPTLTGVTSPSTTVSTLSSLECQVIVSAASSGSLAAVRVRDCPISTVVSPFAVISILSRRTGRLTVAGAESVLPLHSAVAVIVMTVGALTCAVRVTSPS